MAKKYLYIENDGTQRAGVIDTASGKLYTTTYIMPDNSLLGYTGDPNNCNPSNNPGEALLYTSISGTWFVDTGVDPEKVWVKIQDSPGGEWLWIINGDNVLDCGIF